MSRRTSQIEPSWFVELYQSDADPWKFSTSAYEKHKYQSTIEALGRTRYERGFEIGCSNGVLTQLLARRCGRLLAVDVVPKVLETARERCADLPAVEFRLMEVPRTLPDSSFDLILLSEVGYYWDLPGLDQFIDWLEIGMAPSADLVMVHWTGDTDYPLSGDQVHDHVISRTSGYLRGRLRRCEAEYRLDVLERQLGS